MTLTLSHLEHFLLTHFAGDVRDDVADVFPGSLGDVVGVAEVAAAAVVVVVVVAEVAAAVVDGEPVAVVAEHVAVVVVAFVEEELVGDVAGIAEVAAVGIVVAVGEVVGIGLAGAVESAGLVADLKSKENCKKLITFNLMFALRSGWDSLQERHAAGQRKFQPVPDGTLTSCTLSLFQNNIKRVRVRSVF